MLVPCRAAGTSQHGHTPASSHRRGSPESLSLAGCQHFGDIVEAADQTSTKVDGRGSISNGRAGGLDQVSQPLPQGVIHDRLEAAALGVPYSLEQGSHVRIESQGCPHTSKHKRFDVLMPQKYGRIGWLVPCRRGRGGLSRHTAPPGSKPPGVPRPGKATWPSFGIQIPVVRNCGRLMVLSEISNLEA